MGHRLPHVEFWRIFSQPFGAKGREDKQDFLLQILVLRMPKSLSPLVFFEIGTIASDFEPRRSITPVLTWRPSPSFGPSPAHDIPPPGEHMLAMRAKGLNGSITFLLLNGSRLVANLNTSNFRLALSFLTGSFARRFQVGMMGALCEIHDSHSGVTTEWRSCHERI